MNTKLPSVKTRCSARRKNDCAVAQRTDILLHQIGCSRIASLIGRRSPGLAQRRLERGGNRNAVEHCIHRDLGILNRVGIDTSQDRPFL